MIVGKAWLPCPPADFRSKPDFPRFCTGHYKTKLTANSCIGRSSSKNAVSNSSRLFGGFALDFPHYITGKEFKKMKTFIVYDLDSQMPVAVGEQVSAEVRKDEA